MKKVLFVAVSALAVGAAVAGDSTQFGVMKVPSNDKETIVAVPWLESGTGVSDVTVSNLVLTSGLSVGDKLMYYNGSTYVSWIIAEEGGIKVWKSANVVQKSFKTGLDETVATGASSEVKIPLGGAVILKRDNPGTGGFSIMGKPAASGVDQALGAGYSLVAPPSVNTEGTDVNTGMTWTGIVPGDRLLIPVEGKYNSLSWKNGTGWRFWNQDESKWVSTGIKIPMGRGAWFINATNGVGKSFTFGK